VTMEGPGSKLFAVSTMAPGRSPAGLPIRSRPIPRAMILSKQHKFIFIKGVKVAGTSIEIALAPFCGPDDIITPITPIDELMRLACGAVPRNYLQDRAMELAYLTMLRRTAVTDLGKLHPPTAEYFSHMRLCDLQRLQGPAVQNYRVVAVERCPYAKIISWANHQLSFSAYQTGARMRCDRQTVKAFLTGAINERRILAVRNIDRYRDVDGPISARIMRYERLEDDFRDFMVSLGIEYQSELPHAKKGILSNSLDPREFFDDGELELINELFHEEFETFNYAEL
jgi:hypothetical protein